MDTRPLSSIDSNIAKDGKIVVTDESGRQYTAETLSPIVRMGGGKHYRINYARLMPPIDVECQPMPENNLLPEPDVKKKYS